MCEIKNHQKRDKKELSGSLQRTDVVVSRCKLKSDVELEDTSGEFLTFQKNSDFRQLSGLSRNSGNISIK